MSYNNVTRNGAKYKVGDRVIVNNISRASNDRVGTIVYKYDQEESYWSVQLDRLPYDTFNPILAYPEHDLLLEKNYIVHKLLSDL